MARSLSTDNHALKREIIHLIIYISNGRVHLAARPFLILSPQNLSTRLSFRQKRSASLGTSLTINTGRDDSTCIASALSTRKEATNANMLQRFAVAENTHGRRRSRLNGYHDSFIGQETTAHLSKLLEAFLQTMGDKWRHPKVKWTAH
jgi:hypothetical protein